MNIKLIALSCVVLSLTIHAADEKKKTDKKSLEQLAIASYIAAVQKKEDVSYPYTDTHYIAHCGVYSGGESIQLTGILIGMETEIPKDSEDSLGKVLKTAFPNNNFVKKFVNAYQDKRPVSEPCKFCPLIESPGLPIGHMMQLNLLPKGHPLTICPGCHGTKAIVDFVRFAPYSFGIIKKKSPSQVYACYQLTEIRHLTSFGSIPKQIPSSGLIELQDKQSAEVKKPTD